MTRPTGVAPPGYGKTMGKGGSVMITLDELERIKNQVTKTNEDPYVTMRKAEATSLQQVSKTRIKNWPNTMEALRHKREEDRILRLEEEEVSIDLVGINCNRPFECRSSAEKLMLRNSHTRTSYAGSRLRKPTVTCTTLRTW